MDESCRTSLLRSLTWLPFNADQASAAPDKPGVYFIGRRNPDQVLYVGCSDHGQGIRTRIRSHLSGRSNIAKPLADFRTAHPKVDLLFAFIEYSGITDPRAGEDFFLDLLGGPERVDFNRAATARRLRDRIMAHQHLKACPACGRTW